MLPVDASDAFLAFVVAMVLACLYLEPAKSLFVLLCVSLIVIAAYVRPDRRERRPFACDHMV